VGEKLCTKITIGVRKKEREKRTKTM